jgi:hypothetical protein
MLRFQIPHPAHVRSDAHDGAVGLAARAEKEEPGAFKQMQSARVSEEKSPFE